MRFGTFAAILGLLSLSACGGSEPAIDTGPSVTRVDPSSPKGTVWGEVVSAADLGPLPGVSVALSASGALRLATTDEHGRFAFDEVPAGGEVGVSLAKIGYTSATVRVAVPGSAGDFPTEGIGAFVGPIALFSLDGSASVQLIGYDGRDVEGANARAVTSTAWLDLDGGVRHAGKVSVTDVSEAGRLTFTGLPNLLDLAQYDAEISFIVEPVLDEDGTPRYLGLLKTLSATQLLTSGGGATLMLPPPGGDEPLVPIASNVGSLLSPEGVPSPGDSIIGGNETIRVAFNQPLDHSVLEATVFDATGRSVLPTTTTVRNGNLVLIAPNGISYAAGRGYRVVLQAQALGTTSPAKRVTLHGSFFATPPQQEVKVTGVRFRNPAGGELLEAGVRITLELSQAIGLGEGRSDYRIPVFFNLDLNGSGSIGDAVGELNQDQPIWAVEKEPIPPSPMKPSGFTRHFEIVMPTIEPHVGATPYAYGTGTPITFRIDLSSHLDQYAPLMSVAGQVVRTPSELETHSISF